MILSFLVLNSSYSIYRFNNKSVLPDWIYMSDFYSITRTTDEISVVTAGNDTVTEEIPCSKSWKILKISGPLDLNMTGILADISGTLKNHKIPIFVISTFDTDYILVQAKDLDRSVNALEEKGHYVATGE